MPLVLINVHVPINRAKMIITKSGRPDITSRVMCAPAAGADARILVSAVLRNKSLPLQLRTNPIGRSQSAKIGLCPSHGTQNT
jgi:hypothetical protein